MIYFDNVSKVYGGHMQALSDVTVEIKDGEFVFLIGPSGAGKTTFLRLMLRDALPTHGSVKVDEWTIEKLPRSKVHLLRRKIGMVFQDFKLLADRTITENVALALEIHGKRKEDIAKRVEDVLELVRLPHKSHLFPAQLSAGELQRASIARAIASGPPILLADEPTGNLDPDTAWEILEILEAVNKMGTTIIMTTHNATIVNQLKRRTITLKGGKLISDEEKGRYHTAHKQKGHHESAE